MIQLHPDCLMFKLPGGEAIPCSAELVTVELIGDAAHMIDSELMHHAARAVLHYFKFELGQDCVSVSEFSHALARVLRGFGFNVSPWEGSDSACECAESNLLHLASETGDGFELVFFPRLRDELRANLRGNARVLRFTGLQACVKQMLKARRWSNRCQELSDQIVEYMRGCLSSESKGTARSLVVS